MSKIIEEIAEQLQRMINIRDGIRTVLINFGVLTDSASTFDDCLAVLQQMKNNGNVAVVLDTTNTQADVVPGYYAGGSVSVVPQEKTVTANGEVLADSGKVLKKVIVNVNNAPSLQSKTGIIPTKEKQSVTPDAGYDGLSQVDIEAIPDAYQNVSSVTADEADVRSPKIIVKADGSVVAGTMPDNGAVAATIDGLTVDTYVIPKGYHDGTGQVSLTSAIADALAAL